MNNPITEYKLTIEPEIFRDYDGYTALIVYSKNLNNNQNNELATKILREAEQIARSNFAEKDVEDHPHISAWREAFRSFRAKPKKYQCGAEALLKRVVAGSEIPSINPIVDIYNAISIKYAIPAGGEDWKTITSDLTLSRSKGDEPFATMTSHGEQVHFPKAREVIWADNSGTTVRRWNWRQCFRTRITAETTAAYFVLDRLPPLKLDILEQAGQELVELLNSFSPEAVVSTEILGSAEQQ